MKKTHKQLMAGRGQAADVDKSKLAWWEEARFGMFIHWGLYSLPAGVWKGKTIKGIGEWIMYNAKIPLSEYEKLASEFNPTDFDAVQWVALAKEAGMKYLVITTKHHDGFALFHSPSHSYNIVDATPFGRDPIAELAKECAKEGIILGFYYSQDQDWHDPNGAWNDWDFDEESKNFDTYFRTKVEPQITELLTQYGPIGLLWFDTPYTIGKEHSRKLKELVHKLQPNCLVSGRVGHDLGDYGSLGDNQIPLGRITGEYETPATMNNTWGYRSDDDNWKSPATLLYLLVDLASKGINYLLNIGPTGTGHIPEASVERLSFIGKWMNINGEAVYGTKASPFPYEFRWGRITGKGSRLYLIFFDWPQEDFELMGLKNTLLKAYPLSDPTRELTINQQTDSGKSWVKTTLSGFGASPLDPGKPQGMYPVVVLELDGTPVVDEKILQQPDLTISLPAFMSNLHQSQESSTELEINRAGFTDEWMDCSPCISWEFTLLKPGSYELHLHSAAPRKSETRNDSRGGFKGKPHEVTLTLSHKGEIIQTLSGALISDYLVDSPRARHFPEVGTIMGKLNLAREGKYELSLKATYINPTAEEGLALSGGEITPE